MPTRPGYCLQPSEVSLWFHAHLGSFLPRGHRSCPVGACCPCPPLASWTRGRTRAWPAAPWARTGARPPSRCAVSVPKCPQPLLGAAPCPLPSLGGCGVSYGKRGLGVALPCLFPVPPTAPGEEENVSAIVNQEVTLRCPAPGVDPRGSRWLKDGTLLTPSPGMSLSEDGTVLQVMFWGKRRDGREKGVQSISPSLFVAGGASRRAGCGQVHVPGARPPGETLQPERVG